jgi:hypothetical protein
MDALRRSCVEKAPSSLYESIHNQLINNQLFQISVNRANYSNGQELVLDKIISFFFKIQLKN